MHALRRALAAALLARPLLAVAQTQPATAKPALTNAPASAPASTPATRPAQDSLKPGEFLWRPEIAPSGPIVRVVSLDEQRAYVYRNGMAIGVSTTSSGKVGKEPPTGDAEGPLSVLVSLADRRVFALRNGVAFAEAALEVEDGFRIGGSVLIVMDEAEGDAPSVLAPDRPRRNWSAYPILGVDADSLTILRLRLRGMPLAADPGFTRWVYDMLVPCSTLLLTDLPAIRPEAAAHAMQPVLESDESPRPPR